MSVLEVQPAGAPLQGQLRPPGDKSISHRAVLFSLLADGDSEINHFLEAGDTLATLAVCRQLGAEVETEAGRLQVRGAGINGLSAPSRPLDCGNSGTAMRLLAGVLAGQPFASTLVGDPSLSGRPMGRIIHPLRQMGALIEAEDERAPLQIMPANSPLKNQAFDLPVASAQVKSCLLLAGLRGTGHLRLREPGSSRDHTERMLRAAGVSLSREAEGWLRLAGGVERLQPLNLDVPADPSSAAFLMAAALLVDGSEISLEEVGINPTRTGLFDAFRAMGAELDLQQPAGEATLEPVATLRVSSSPLRGIDLPVGWVPRMIDELPLLLAAAVFAEGVTRIRGAAELRVKESDRLAAMASGFDALDIDYQLYEDGMDVRGLGSRSTIRGGNVDAQGDHRIAMSFAVMALRASRAIRIHNAEMIATSYPDFARHLQSLGAEVTFA